MQGPKFIIDKAALENHLKKIKPDGRRKKKVINQLVLEVSLTTDQMTLTVPGFHLDLDVQGTGAGKVSPDSCISSILWKICPMGRSFFNSLTARSG